MKCILVDYYTSSFLRKFVRKNCCVFFANCSCQKYGRKFGSCNLLWKGNLCSILYQSKSIKILKNSTLSTCLLLLIHAVSIIEVYDEKQDLCSIEIVNWFLNVNRRGKNICMCICNCGTINLPLKYSWNLFEILSIILQLYETIIFLATHATSHQYNLCTCS